MVHVVEIVKGHPPIYDKIVAAFPAVTRNRGVVFTYGNTLYNPGGWPIDEPLMTHEETHSAQQGKMGKDAWWDKYLVDPAFRTEQELEAYQAQFKVAKQRFDRPVWRRELKRLAKDLSSGIYGNILSYEQAEATIRKGGD